MTVYATPADLWQLALPPDSLYGEQGIEPGPSTDPARTSGSGLGSVLVWERSNPRSDFAVRLLVASGGELNQDGYLNPGPEPTFRISLDAGVGYSRLLRPDRNGRIDYTRGGFGLVLANGTSGAPVTIGSGNASLVYTPKRAGGSVQVLVGTTLSCSITEGALVLTVTGTTTAAQAAAYLLQQARVLEYMGVAAGGDGSGAVLAAAKQGLAFSSFTTGDVWSFSTTASPDVLAALRVASALAEGYLPGSYTLPLLSWGDDLRRAVCWLARWELLCRRGLDKAQDAERYDPEKQGVLGWLREVRDGTTKLATEAVESAPGVSFPLLVQPIDPLSEEAGSFPI